MTIDSAVLLLVCLILDVAIGSPFGGKSGGGCVYIYKGERSGLSAQPSQILENPLSTPSKFGFTLRGGKDIDNNGYPGNHQIQYVLESTDCRLYSYVLCFVPPIDLIVGAFGADTVYVYR